jgi:hypothetical protein
MNGEAGGADQLAVLLLFPTGKKVQHFVNTGFETTSDDSNYAFSDGVCALTGELSVANVES